MDTANQEVVCNGHRMQAHGVVLSVSGTAIMQIWYCALDGCPARAKSAIGSTTDLVEAMPHNHPPRVSLAGNEQHAQLSTSGTSEEPWACRATEQCAEGNAKITEGASSRCDEPPQNMDQQPLRAHYWQYAGHERDGREQADSAIGSGTPSAEARLHEHDLGVHRAEVICRPRKRQLSPAPVPTTVSSNAVVGRDAFAHRTQTVVDNTRAEVTEEIGQDAHCNGYRMRKDRVYHSHTGKGAAQYWSCIWISRGCGGRAASLVGSKELMETRPHNHHADVAPAALCGTATLDQPRSWNSPTHAAREPQSRHNGEAVVENPGDQDIATARMKAYSNGHQMSREGVPQTNVYGHGRAQAAVEAARLIETEPHNDADGTPPPKSKKSTNPTREDSARAPTPALKGSLQIYYDLELKSLVAEEGGYEWRKERIWNNGRNELVFWKCCWKEHGCRAHASSTLTASKFIVHVAHSHPPGQRP